MIPVVINLAADDLHLKILPIKKTVYYFHISINLNISGQDRHQRL